MNRFVPFLAVDPQPDPNPGSRDAEEASMEVGVVCSCLLTPPTHKHAPHTPKNVSALCSHPVSQL